MTAPVYNGVNPNYPGLRVLNTSPPIFAVDNFLTPFECDFLINVAQDSFGPAPVVGKGVGEVSPSRTSSTCYLAREDLPDLMRKVSVLAGKPPQHCELPQVGRYFPSQHYLQHYDAFDLSTEDGRRFAANGGQRTMTCLLYLNDVIRGGATRFPALDLDVQPRRGMALLFFPATIDGMLDKMALHAALPAIDTKYVSQVWIRQSTYNGQPSKRLAQTLGVPFAPSPGQRVASLQTLGSGTMLSNTASPWEQQQTSTPALRYY
jgi:prolyl 4-hydroxylase